MALAAWLAGMSRHSLRLGNAGTAFGFEFGPTSTASTFRTVSMPSITCRRCVCVCV